VKVGAIVLLILGALGLMTSANLFLVDPARVRHDFVGMVILPGVLMALGAYLWKKAQPPAPIDAEIVDDPPEKPPA
jgi:hypothetical protein